MTRGDDYHNGVGEYRFYRVYECVGQGEDGEGNGKEGLEIRCNKDGMEGHCEGARRTD